MDRLDLELLKSTFHADGEVHFGIFDGNAHGFCDFDIPFIRDNLTMGSHRFSTATIRFETDTRALSESYMLGNAAAPSPGGTMLNFPDNIRYLDVWEKRDGVWRMYCRELVLDWNAFWSYSQREDGLFTALSRGARDLSDLSYALRAGC
ncbi:hypothetical protein D3C80_1752890 [compost metagenome]